MFFATDKDDPAERASRCFQAVAHAPQAAPGIRLIRIDGHTDSQGNRLYNIDLSQRRTRARNWLIQHGIEESRLAAEGYGPDRPIATNKTVEGRQNRRVEFHIVDNGGVTTAQ